MMNPRNYLNLTANQENHKKKNGFEECVGKHLAYSKEESIFFLKIKSLVYMHNNN